MSFSWAKLFVSVLLVLWWLFLPSYRFPDDGIIGHAFYSLCHANIWHLMANVLCLWMIRCELHLCISTILAIICSFFPCFISEPTCGFSGVLFSIVGMSWGRVRRFRDMLWRNKWFLIIPIFIPHVNALLHVYCLLVGWLVGRFWYDRTMPQWTKDWL